MIGQEFEVWICPECKGSIYVDGRGDDLALKMNRDLKFQPTFERDVCQRCSTPAKRIHRKRYIARVVREWETPRPQMTEAQYFQYMEETRQEGEKRRAREGH